MNFKLFLKAVLILAVLAVLVMMGLNNPQDSKLLLPPLIPANKGAGGAGPAICILAVLASASSWARFLMTGGKKGGASKPGKEK